MTPDFQASGAPGRHPLVLAASSSEPPNERVVGVPFVLRHAFNAGHLPYMPNRVRRTALTASGDPRPRLVPRADDRTDRAAARPEVQRCEPWDPPRRARMRVKGRPRPLEFEPCAASVAERGTTARDSRATAPHPSRASSSGSTTVGSAHVLVVDEELVEVGQAPHPTDAEETWWRSGSDRCNEPVEVFTRECGSSSFGEAAPRTGEDEPWCRE